MRIFLLLLMIGATAEAVSAQQLRSDPDRVISAADAAEILEMIAVGQNREDILRIAGAPELMRHFEGSIDVWRYRTADEKLVVAFKAGKVVEIQTLPQMDGQATPTKSRSARINLHRIISTTEASRIKGEVAVGMDRQKIFEIAGDPEAMKHFEDDIEVWRYRAAEEEILIAFRGGMAAAIEALSYPGEDREDVEDTPDRNADGADRQPSRLSRFFDVLGEIAQAYVDATDQQDTRDQKEEYLHPRRIGAGHSQAEVTRRVGTPDAILNATNCYGAGCFHPNATFVYFSDNWTYFVPFRRGISENVRVEYYMVAIRCSDRGVQCFRVRVRAN